MKRIEEDILRALLARNEWVESPIFTAHCEQLVKDGYIEAKPGRSVEVRALRITKKGRDYLRNKAK